MTDTAETRKARLSRSGMTDLVALEFNDLSFEEREGIYEDLHAVSRPKGESPMEISDSIASLKKALANMKSKSAFNTAQFLNPEYFDESFFLMFLRSAKFDTKKAAQTIADHFKHKLELFGPEVLGRDIRYEDLDDETKQALGTGAVQIPRCRDAAGRAILIFSHSHFSYKNADCQIRAVWYMLMCALKDPETQRNGLIYISFNLNHSSKNLNLDLVLKSASFQRSMPRKVMGFHFCYNSDLLRPILSTLQGISGMSTRQRLRTFMDIVYSLKTYGIPLHALPIDTNGSFKCSEIFEYIAHRIEEEEQQTRHLGDKIMHPLSTDVLLGRGWHQLQHRGNCMLAKIIDAHRETYKVARKMDKANLNRQIVQLVQESGGRFLERSKLPQGGWVEACDDIARDKVSKSFRTLIKRRSHLNHWKQYQSNDIEIEW
eukprot:scaffold758_cov104-Cylindrotheca_fusiformis.AAC.11